MKLLDATHLNLVKVICQRCNNTRRINYSSGFTVFVNALDCPECESWKRR